MRDLASQLGVSQTTVSLALKDHPRISAAMRSKVKALAEKMGYVPDPVVSQLGSLRWKNASGVMKNTLALIVPNQIPGGRERNGDRDCWEAFQERAKAQGYGADCFAFSDYDNLDQLVSVLYHRGIRGVAFTRMWDPSFATHEWFSGLAVVDVNFGLIPTAYHKVQLDRFGEVGIAVQKALAAGFSRIALVLLDEPTASDRPFRSSSYAHHLAAGGKELLPIFDVQLAQDTWAAEAARLKRFILKHRVEVIIALNGLVAHLLRLAKVHVPGEVSYIDLAAQPGERITGLYEDFHALGEAVIDTLDTLIRTGQSGGAAEPRTVILGKKWVYGETLASPATVGG
jgi:LacI family transcriptional regulator